MRGLLGLLAKAEDLQEDEQGWKQPDRWCRVLA